MTQTAANPRLVDLYRNAVVAVWKTSAEDQKLHEAMKNLAKGLCHHIADGLPDIGDHYIFGTQQDFTDDTWNALAARFRPTPDDAALMRTLLFQQFQQWATDPAFNIPSGYLNIDNDGIMIVSKTSVPQPPVTTAPAGFTRASLFHLTAEN